MLSLKEGPNQTEILRFTKLALGLVQFPFILKETIDEHLSSYTEKYPADVAERRDDLYVDDLITGGESF